MDIQLSERDQELYYFARAGRLNISENDRKLMKEIREGSKKIKNFEDTYAASATAFLFEAFSLLLGIILTITGWNSPLFLWLGIITIVYSIGLLYFSIFRKRRAALKLKRDIIQQSG